MISTDNWTMAGEDGRPRRRHALFGVAGKYVEALEQALTQTQSDLSSVRAENAELTSSLNSARHALDESAGWSARLPGALRELGALAGGELDPEDAQQRLAAAVLALAGEHLLASVDVSIGEPAGDLQATTDRNQNGRPVRSTVRLGGCIVDCTWQPGVDAGPDTTQVIEGLCTAVVCSLAGVATARAERELVTQLGDKRALARHLALRQRLAQPAALVRVTVDGHSAIAHRELFGRLAWNASLADAASTLERLARAHGGQAYQTDDREFRLLVDSENAEQACELAEGALVDYDGLIFRVSVVEQ
jgi:GGDEF domain-containing protein